MRRWRVLLLSLVLLVAVGQPVRAEGGEGGRVVFGGDFTLARGEQLDGDLVVFGGDAVLEPESAVHGSVVVFGGSVHIAGQVDEDVVVFGGRANLDAMATVGGNVVATGGTVGDSRSVVGGSIVGGAERRRDPLSAWRWRLPALRGLGALGDLLLWGLQTAAVLLAMLAVGALVVLLVPELVRTASRALVEYPVESVGAGLLTAVVAALLLPLLVLLCLGIPLAVAGGLALAIALLFGWIAAGLALGERLLVALQQAERRPVPAVVLGLLVLTLLSRAPGLGVLVAALAGVWGLGAVVLSRFGTVRYAGRRPGTAGPLASPPGSHARQGRSE